MKTSYAIIHHVRIESSCVLLGLLRFDKSLCVTSFPGFIGMHHDMPKSR